MNINKDTLYYGSKKINITYNYNDKLKLISLYQKYIFAHLEPLLELYDTKKSIYDNLDKFIVQIFSSALLFNSIPFNPTFRCYKLKCNNLYLEPIMYEINKFNTDNEIIQCTDLYICEDKIINYLDNEEEPILKISIDKELKNIRNTKTCKNRFILKNIKAEQDRSVLIPKIHNTELLLKLILVVDHCVSHYLEQFICGSADWVHHNRETFGSVGVTYDSVFILKYYKNISLECQKFQNKLMKTHIKTYIKPIGCMMTINQDNINQKMSLFPQTFV